MALVEGCRHALEISIPVDEVESETSRVTAEIQKRAKLPGFRPGKAPASLIRKQFASDIRQQVLESLIPSYLQKQIDAENLNVVGRPDITDVHFHDGEPLSFKAEFEVVPQIELQEYNDVEVPYHDPEVTDEDVDKRLDELRETKADYVNVDPRPVADGRSRGGGARKRGGRGRRAGQAGRNGARDRRRRYLRGFHRQSAGALAGRREGVRGHLSGRLRGRPAGRKDREISRHGEGHPPQGTARAER